jgi:hypothetical protein
MAAKDRTGIPNPSKYAVSYMWGVDAFFVGRGECAEGSRAAPHSIATMLATLAFQMLSW